MLANKFKYIFIIKFISLIIGLLIFAGLNFYAPNPNNINSNNIVFILDISHSMNTQDISGLTSKISRLDLAKKIMTQTISDYPNKSFGIILFAGSADYYIPPTLDTQTLLDHINTLNTGILPQGGSNIYQGLKMFSDAEKNSIGILISDFGEDRDFSDQQSELNKLKLGTNNLVLVGLGSDKGDYIKYPNGEYIKENGDVVISKLNSKSAQKISDIFGVNLIKMDNQNNYNINISSNSNQVMYIKPSQKIYYEFIGILFTLAGL